jgi:hypothetical protein
MAPCLVTSSATSIIPNATTGVASGCAAAAGSDAVGGSLIKVASSFSSFCASIIVTSHCNTAATSCVVAPGCSAVILLGAPMVLAALICICVAPAPSSGTASSCASAAASLCAFAAACGCRSLFLSLRLPLLYSHAFVRPLVPNAPLLLPLVVVPLPLSQVVSSPLTWLHLS